MNEGDVIDTTAEMGEKVRNVFPALAVLIEFPLWLDDAPFVLLAPPTEGLHRDRLPVHPIHRRFVVEGVDVTGTAIHEEENDALGLPADHGRFGFQRICRTEGLAEESLAAEQPGQGKRRKAASDRADKLAAVHPSAEVTCLASVHGINRGK